MNVDYVKLDKIYKVKEINGEKNGKFLTLLKKEEPIILLGLYRKKKLVGMKVCYKITKKDFKKLKINMKRNSVMKFQIKILKKYRTPEIKTFFQTRTYRIFNKSFPKICYSLKAL